MPADLILSNDGIQFANGSVMGRVPRSLLAGLTLSTAGSSTTMSIAAGQASDSANACLMDLNAAIAKTTAAWAVGTATGGLDTGAIANSTWYHFYVIRRPDTGVVDVVFSLSATSPTLPTNYTQFRRIGSGRTNGSGQWTSFVQDGDYFYWRIPVGDIVTTSIATANTLYTMTTPLGVAVKGLFRGRQVQGVSGYTNFWEPARGLVGVGLNTPGYLLQSDSATGATVFKCEILTNTASQIYGAATNSNNVTVWTDGWVDTRGKDL
jgi:hypothetical protein